MQHVYFIMDAQSGELEEKEVVGEGMNESEMGELVYQDEVDEVTTGADSRYNVKHEESSDQLFFRKDDEGGRTKVTTDEERVLR